LALKESEVDNKEKEVFVTHFHLDHVGLCAKLEGMVSSFFSTKLKLKSSKRNLMKGKKKL